MNKDLEIIELDESISNEINSNETNLNKNKLNVNKTDSDKMNHIDVEKESEKNSKEQGNGEQISTSKAILREILSWILTFAIAIGAAFFIKSFIIINATVPTGSMENTIMPGDDLIGFRLAYKFSEPERGDIIIFKYPDDETQKFVKRIIGLPGETVRIEDAKVYINDSKEPLEEPYLRDEWVKMTGPFEYEIPEDCYLVLGDNRNNSKDSRYWVNSFVTKDEIIGKASFIYFPFNRFGSLN